MTGQIDFVTEAQRLEGLKRERTELVIRLGAIDSEIIDHYNVMRSEIGRVFGDVPITQTQIQPKSRPLEHRVTIAAGRAIVEAIKLRLGPSEAKQKAIVAAAVVGRRYGLERLPAKVLHSITQRVASKYNVEAHTLKMATVM